MINGSRFAVFTDMHFGIHANNRKFVEICKDTMAWISSYCTIEKISDVLFCGDFFDSRSSIDVNTMSAATESLYAMADSGIRVTMVLGNHDIYLRDSTSVHSLLAYGGHGGIEIVDSPKAFELCGHGVMLIPWMYGVPSAKVDVPRGIKYVFCHHNFPASYFIGGGKRGKGKSDSFVSNTPYEDEFGIQNEVVSEVVENGGVVFSGHIHQNSEVPLPNGAKLIIGGSPYETNWGFGNAECGMYVFDAESGSCEFVKNPKNRRHVELRTSEFDSHKDDVCGSIVRLVVDTQEPFDSISKKQTEIRELNPFMVDSTKYEFDSAGFVGKRDESKNELKSIGEKPTSKLEYISKAIENADFSQFAYLSGSDSVDVSKERVMAMASETYERVVAR